MMKFAIAILVVSGWLLPKTEGQSQKLLGLVVQRNEKGVEEPVAGANVYWSRTTLGTTSRDNGVFLIDKIAGNNVLVISFVGKRTDTVIVTDQSNLKVELMPAVNLSEVTIEGGKPTTQTDYNKTINTAVMNEKELFKAACCNLSESFETNPSVDVAFTDAVTGARQIQMLGLSGPNIMVSTENMPGVRGLAAIQGLEFIPGPWVSSIQVTKGVGSVVNGYESIAGQINVELHKPQESGKLYLNGYVNSSGRSETNAVYTLQTGKKWATTFLVHGDVRPFEMDQNKDSFLDFPKGQQVNVMNRWVFNSGTGWLGQFSIKALSSHKLGGQTGYEPETEKYTSSRYGMEINTERYEFTGKVGYQFAGKPYKSFGLQVSALDHDMNSYYGFRDYTAHESSGYVNWIYQSIISSTAHKFKTGVSFLYDAYDETISGENRLNTHESFRRTEQVPGAFVEYTYDNGRNFSAVVGGRADHHNLFGTFYTPRIHLRFNPVDGTTIRLQAGKGTRVANIFAENPGFLASSRSLSILNTVTAKSYGYLPDVAWNYGISVNQEFTFNYHPGSINVDYFFTDFQRQVIADYEDWTQMRFYPLQGKSFSHSAQVQLDYQLIRRLDLRVAYRWVDVQADYIADGRRQRPLIPEHRYFANLAYATRGSWKFDATLQGIGRQRIPFTPYVSPAFNYPTTSQPYVLVNVQVTKDLGARWSVYVGGENLTNFKLKYPIVGSDDPFGHYFDSSKVWGPVFGRMWYGGVRYRVK